MTDKNERYFVVQIQDAASLHSFNHCILHNGYLEFWSGNRSVARLDDSWLAPNSSIRLIDDKQLLDTLPARSWWFTPLKRSDVNDTPVACLIKAVLWFMVLVMCCFVGKCAR